MLTKKIKIINKLGIHARAALKLSNLAERFQSDILIRYMNREVNAKCIMSVMVLAANHGAEIELTITGADEEEAYLAIETLISERFGEAE